jgi:hypothetical protein
MTVCSSPCCFSDSNDSALRIANEARSSAGKKGANPASSSGTSSGGALLLVAAGAGSSASAAAALTPASQRCMASGGARKSGVAAGETPALSQRTTGMAAASTTPSRSSDRTRSSPPRTAYGIGASGLVSAKRISQRTRITRLPPGGARRADRGAQEQNQPTAASNMRQADAQHDGCSHHARASLRPPRS